MSANVEMLHGLVINGCVADDSQTQQLKRTHIYFVEPRHGLHRSSGCSPGVRLGLRSPQDLMGGRSVFQAHLYGSW